MSSKGLQTTLDLLELGTDLLAQRLRRDDPDMPEEDVAAAVTEWLSDRSQSPHADAVGHRGTWAKETLTDLEQALRQLVADLGTIDASYALVGGLAVSIRAEPRLTRDADVAISVDDDADAEAVINQLIEIGYRPHATIEHETSGRLAAVRLTHNQRSATIVNLLFASCGIEPEIVEDAEELEVLPGLIVPVASKGHLIAMKLLARAMTAIAHLTTTTSNLSSIRLQKRILNKHPPRSCSS